jgi:hypothetical protein
MKLNEQQEALIEQLASAADRRREARINARERARKLVEAELLAFDIEVQKLCARGEQLEISYRQMAQRGLKVENGTTARKEAEEGRKFIDLTETPAPAEKPSRFDFDAEHGRLTVTFQPADFAGKIEGITELQTLAFYVDGDRLTPEGEDYSHPVARLALTPDGRKEIAAYLASIN